MLKKRIIAGLSGNVLLQAVNAMIQIFGVPLCLAYWKQDYYGEWLLLFTIPGYLSVSDFGLGTSSTAEMSMMAEDQRQHEIQPLLRSVFWVIVLWGFIPFGLLLASNYFWPWYSWLKLQAVQVHEFKATFPILVLYIYLSLFLTVPLNYYRVIKQYHVERYISTVYKLLEFGVLLILVLRGLGIFAVALGYLLLRTLYFFFIVFDLHRRSEIFRLWPVQVHFREVRKILKPGISGLFFYLGGNLLNQGLSTIIGLNFGPRKLVMFNTVRMMTNLAKQVFNVVNLSLYSEFSFAYGAKNMRLMQRLVRSSLFINLVMSGGAAIVLFFFGNLLLHWWTKGVVYTEPLFLGIFLLYTVLGAISSVAITVVFATNSFRNTGLQYLLLVSTLIIINALWVKALGLNMTALTLVLFELLMIWLCGKVVLTFIQTDWKRLLRAMSYRDLLPDREPRDASRMSRE